MGFDSMSPRLLPRNSNILRYTTHPFTLPGGIVLRDNGEQRFGLSSLSSP
jgi:hypothetical protein